MKVVFTLLSALWGAWVGFGGYFNLKSNSETFAMLFVFGYYVVFAGIGLVTGGLVSLTVWLLVETIRRRIKAPPLLTPLIAGVLSFLSVWQITDYVYAFYPGLHS